MKNKIKTGKGREGKKQMAEEGEIEGMKGIERGR
jgi:hypothetical protein